MATAKKLDRDLFLSSQCFNVLRSMREHRFGRAFDKPVVDNLSLISKPMDFITIKSKLAKNLYRNTEDEFAEDVRLVFANAMLYHPPDNSIHKTAKELKKFFEIRWELVKKNLACVFPRIEVADTKQSLPETSEASSSSGSFYLDQKVSRSTNPESKSVQDSKVFVLALPTSPKKALREATIKIRFAETIVKAKYKRLFEESSSNKADVMKKIQKEKQLLETSQREEKARMEAEIRAPMLKLRHKRRLALEKMEEEAIFNIEHHLTDEKEIVNLCGGSYQARTRRVEEFGLFLKSDDDCLDEIESEACDDKEEGEII